MNRQRDDLILQLSEELEPVAAAGKTRATTALWLFCSLAFSGVAMSLLGPFRDGWFTQLVNHPQLALETLLGLGSVFSAGMLIFISGIPGHPQRRTLTITSLLLMGAWIASMIFSVFYPAMPVSMAGKREHCVWEVLSIALPCVMLGGLLLHRMLPLGGWRDGIILALAAGIIPAFMMNMACMYNPVHSLMYHVLPIAILLPVGALSIWLFERGRWRR